MVYILKHSDTLEAKKYINVYALKKRIDANEISYVELDEKNNDINAFLETDLFNPIKLIVVNDCNFLTNLKDFKNNFDLINDLNKNTSDIDIFLLVENKILTNKEFKDSTSNFEYIEIKKIDNNAKKKYVDQLLNENNLKLPTDIYAHLLSSLSNNYGNIKNEIDKLLIGINAKLSNEQLHQLISNYNEENIFNLIEFMLLKKYNLAWKIYNDLINRKEDEIYIIQAISGQLFNLYNILELTKQNVPINKIADILGLSTYVINIYKKNFINYNIKELLKIINLLYKLEVDIKTSKIDKQIGFRQFLVKI